MQNDLLHEVATPLQLDVEGWDEPRLYPINDDTYKRYTRCLRHYYRMAWWYHTCWYCNKPISDFYEAWVYVARPGVFVPFLGRTATFWVEKHHYPECPDRLREYEEEMYATWDREDRERAAAERKAA